MWFSCKLIILLIVFSMSQAVAEETELNRLVSQFYASAAKYLPKVPLIKIPVVFGNPKESIEETEGACYFLGDTPHHIEIDKDSWAKYDHWGRQELIYHELGHCILGLQFHDDSDIILDNQKIKKSLMATRMLSENVFLLHRDYYLKELFSRYTKKGDGR